MLIFSLNLREELKKKNQILHTLNVGLLSVPLIRRSSIVGKEMVGCVRFSVGIAHGCSRFLVSFKNIVASKCCWQIRSSCTFALLNKSNRRVFSIQILHLFKTTTKNINENINRFGIYTNADQFICLWNFFSFFGRENKSHVITILMCDNARGKKRML